MGAHRDTFIREEDIKDTDIAKFDELAIASTRNASGTEIAARIRLVQSTARGSTPPQHIAERLVVFIDDPEDDRAADRIRKAFDVSEDTGWHCD